MKDVEILSALVRKMASGAISYENALPIMRELSQTAENPISDAELIGVLSGQFGSSAAKLINEISSLQFKKALQYYRLKSDSANIPPELLETFKDYPLQNISGWKPRNNSIPLLKDLFSILQDYSFVLKHKDALPSLPPKLKECFNKIAIELNNNCIFDNIDISKILEIIPHEAPELAPLFEEIRHQFDANVYKTRREIVAALDKQPNSLLCMNVNENIALEILKVRLNSLINIREKTAVLDTLCCWPTEAVTDILRTLTLESSLQKRAIIILTLRFGWKDDTCPDWDTLICWIENRDVNNIFRQSELNDYVKMHPALIVLLWYSGLKDKNSNVMEQLAGLAVCDTAAILPVDIIQRHSGILTEDEVNILANDCKKQEPPPVQANIHTDDQAALHPIIPPPLPAAVSSLKNIEKEIPLPSLWVNHIQPFFAENWYMAAGIFMVIAGSSLLAFYTWDKHWMVPYTIMPLLLGFFTAGLAKTGSWVEKRGKEFLNMAAMLRGAAISLLPINFMTVALLSNDSRVTNKILLVPLMSLLYLLLGGWGLRRWCSSIHQASGKLLGFTLLLINFLVILAPIVKSFPDITPGRLNFILGAGFYTGFVFLSYSVIFFTRNFLTKEMVQEKRIPWFFTSILIITFIQVFAWVHGFTGCLPHVFTYSPMIILAGGVLLFIEKHAQMLKEETSGYSSSSFIGFGLILLGVLMGLPDREIRILAFELAGFVWLFQSVAKKHPVHYWISLSLIAMGCVSVSLLRPVDGIWLPVERWMPVTGVVTALLMSAFIYSGKRLKNQLLTEAAAGMQAALLAMTAAAAVLAQLHYASAPSITAVCLVAVTVMFLWRAFTDNNLRWLHTAMLIAVLALPYIGCVDVLNKTMQNNTLVFGLSVISVLWLTACRLIRHPLLLKARSTIMFFYGLLALAAMILRIFIHGKLPPNVFMDYSGPLIITVVLVFTAYYSRSLVPAGIGAIILIILFPELKSHFQQEFEHIGWGTGLGGSVSAFLLICSCFFLKNAGFLKNLKDGDLFLGKYAFPARRFDYTLFTWPVLLSALFLLIKADAFTIPGNLLRDGIYRMPVQSSIALSVTGIGWALISIYYRTHRSAAAGIHLGLLCLLAGISCGYYRLAEAPHIARLLLYCGLIVQALYFIFRYGLERKFQWANGLLTSQMHLVLKIGGLVLALACSTILIEGENPPVVTLLAIFTAAQLIWHGLTSRHVIHGTFLYFFIWLNIMAWSLPGSKNLVDRIIANHDIMATLYFLISIQLIHLILEFRRTVHEQLKPVLKPFLFLGTFTVVVMGLAGLADAFHCQTISTGEQILLLAAIFIAARTHANAALAVLGLFILYVLVTEFPANSDFYDKITILTAPLKLAFFGLLFAFCGGAWRIFRANYPKLMESPFSQIFFRAPSPAWFFIPGIFFSLISSSHQVSAPALRSDTLQSLAPYVSAAATVFTAVFWNFNPLFYLAIAFMGLGNIHMVRIHLGHWLTSMGLSRLHLVCIGLAATMLVSTIIKYFLKRETASIYINRTCIVLAAMVLALLTINYSVSPDLMHIAWFRFTISGTISLIAGLYFRRAARSPGPGEEKFVDLCEGVFHYALSVTIWCAALMIPWFRTPYTALYALSLPVIYFYCHAEFKIRADSIIGRRYLNSASVLSAVILALYVFRFALQMTMFPDSRIDLMHYHYCAPAIIAVSIIMLRLHGLGGSYWLAFYGGLGLMTGTYFTLTLLPHLSPFDYPVNGAFCAVIISHLWIILSYPEYPFSSFVKTLARIDDPKWLQLRRCWGWFIAAATHAAVGWGLINYSENTFMVTPLLACGASIFIHQGIIKKSPLYYGIAALELLIAIHADFLVPSWLAKDHIIWVFILAWFIFLTARELLKSKVNLKLPGAIYASVFVIIFLHVLYHAANSTTGLAGFAAAAILAAATPCRNRSARNILEIFPAALLLWAPAWLIFFGQAHDKQFTDFFSVRSILTGALSLLITGTAAKYYKSVLISKYNLVERSQPRLFDLTLSWLDKSGYMVNIAMLCVILPSAGWITLLNHHTAFETGNFSLILLLYLGSAAAWSLEGIRLNRMLPFFIMEVCAVGAWSVSRCQIINTIPGFWKYEYDIWFSLFVAGIASGLLQLPAINSKKIRVPLTFMLCAMPVSALASILLNNMGTNILLLVIGLYSIIFVFMGKDDKESPYHIAAVTGFVAFIMLLLWTKLELRVVHAYVIPAGAGVLVLLQLFRDRVRPDVRNHVRLITLLAMLGSAGYYALMGSNINIYYILTLGILSIVVMLLGSFLRIKLYLAIGFCGLIVDVCVVFCKLIIKMQRSSQMTIIGSLVLVGGIAIVTGAILYKTHREKFIQFLNKMREKFNCWE